MSESVLANLPRYDTRSPAQARGGLGTARFDTPLNGLGKQSGVQLSDIELAEQQSQQAANRAAEQEAAIAATLTSVTEALGRIETESRERSVAMLQSMAATLFPKLSELFLAEELARHLPEILPEDTPGIEIMAGQDVATRLSQVLEQRGGLAEAVTVKPVNDLAGAQVQISWKTGGLDFDFEELLSACMAQLNAHTDTD